MACEKYTDDEELLALFDSVFDKEIKDSRKKKLFAHLDACASCSMQFKLYEAMINGMERLEEVEAPLDLTAGVMKGIQGEPQPQWEAYPLPFLRPASTSWMWAGAFAVAFFLMIGTFVNHDGGSKQAKLPPQLPAGPVAGETPHLGEDRNQDELAPKQPRAPAGPGAGITLVQHQGEVEVYDQATDRWRAIYGLENLNFGERVRTGPGGVASLEYVKEQVALRIKPSSTFQVLDRQTLRMFAGNAWVLVKRKGTVFRTETPNAIASVRGTKYSVEVQPLPEVYANETVAGINRLLLPRQGVQGLPNNAPRSSASLPAYSAYVAISMARQLADGAIPIKVNTEVKVYESVVEVIAKNSAGVEVSSVDVGEGFKSQVQLAAVAKPGVMSQDDLLAWKGVMVFNPELLERAHAKLAGTGSRVDTSSATPGTVGPAGVLTAPPAGTRPAATDAGPVSTTDRPAGYDDVNRR